MSRPKWQTAFKLSYSEKRDITVCPHRYELIAIDKVQTFDVDIARRLLVPNVLDMALDLWVKATFTGSIEEIAVARYARYIQENERSIKWKHPMDMRDCELKLRDASVKLEAGMRNAGLCTSDAVSQPDCKALLELSNGEQLKLTGRLDLLYTEEPSIWDLKTTDNVKWLDVDQLIYYDFAMSILLGRKVKRCGFLAPLIDPCVQEIPAVGRDAWNKLMDQLGTAVSRIHNKDFPDLGDEQQDCFMCFAKRFCKRRGRGPATVVPSGKVMKVGGF